MGTVSINGGQYSYTSLTVIGAGRDIIGLRGIDYAEKQEKELLYGKGDKPIGIQRGNKSYEGTLKVLQSELEGLEDLSSSGSIMDLNINLTLCYGNPAAGEPMRTDVLYGVEFTEAKKGMSQGDKMMEVELPFICEDIVWNS